MPRWDISLTAVIPISPTLSARNPALQTLSPPKKPWLRCGLCVWTLLCHVLGLHCGSKRGGATAYCPLWIPPALGQTPPRILPNIIVSFAWILGTCVPDVPVALLVGGRWGGVRYGPTAGLATHRQEWDDLVAADCYSMPHRLTWLDNPRLKIFQIGY